MGFWKELGDAFMEGYNGTQNGSTGTRYPKYKSFNPEKFRGYQAAYKAFSGEPPIDIILRTRLIAEMLEDGYNEEDGAQFYALIAVYNHESGKDYWDDFVNDMFLENLIHVEKKAQNIFQYVVAHGDHLKAHQNVHTYVLQPILIYTMFEAVRGLKEEHYEGNLFNDLARFFAVRKILLERGEI